MNDCFIHCKVLLFWQISISRSGTWQKKEGSNLNMKEGSDLNMKGPQHFLPVTLRRDILVTFLSSSCDSVTTSFTDTSSLHHYPSVGWSGIIIQFMITKAFWRLSCLLETGSLVITLWAHEVAWHCGLLSCVNIAPDMTLTHDPVTEHLCLPSLRAVRHRQLLSCSSCCDQLCLTHPVSPHPAVVSPGLPTSVRTGSVSGPGLWILIGRGHPPPTVFYSSTPRLSTR